EIYLRAFVGSPDASVDLRRSSVGPVHDPERLGRELAAVLLQEGAADILPSKTDQPDASRPDRPVTERAL
ncbi:MAG TPA: hydroxymethylbilane synthase, partial [Dermatophilaceae bacterium]